MAAWLERNAGRVLVECWSSADPCRPLSGAFGQAAIRGGTILSSAVPQPPTQDGALRNDQLSKVNPEPVWARNAASKTDQNR